MKIIFILITGFIMFSCTDCNFDSFSDLKKFAPYHNISDTIIFESDKGNFDTIRIAEIDSIKSCGSFMNGKNENLYISIEHIPQDNWQYGEISNDSGGYRPYYQFLININRDPIIRIEIEYRDFKGKLNILNHPFVSRS